MSSKLTSISNYSYGVSIDATSYIYASEIFPTPERAKGMAISISGLFCATTIFLSAAPTAFAAIGWKYYIVFVIYTALMVPVVYFFFPETSRKSLEEVQAAFGDSVEGLTKEKEDEIYRTMGHHKGHHQDVIAREKTGEQTPHTPGDKTPAATHEAL